MINDLKIYIIIVLALWQGIAQWQLNSVKSEYREYKESINDQVQQAKNDRLRIEAEQRAKLDKAKLDYSDSRKRLSDALDRLRKSESMLWTCTLPVAGSSSGTMPRSPESTTGTTNAIEATTGARSFNEFYELAMKDTLQCSQLIKFITSQNGEL